MPLISKFLRPAFITFVCWIVTLVVLSCVRTRWEPRKCTTAENVSGFYGPGAFWAWVLTSISAIFKTFAADRKIIASVDFIGSFLYALAAMGDWQLRICPDCLEDDSDLQLKASLQIVGVSNLFCFLALVLGESYYDEMVLSSNHWQLWKAFLLAHYFQLTLWVSQLIRNNIFEALMISICFFFSMGRLWTAARENGFVRCIRYYCVALPIFSYVRGLGPAGRLSALPLSPPLSGAKLSDMDQALTLVTAILILTAQWKAWRCIPWLAKGRKKRDQSSNEENKDEPYVLPVIPTSTR